jgi:selenide,water dikinase
VCDPSKPCPCEIFKEKNICLCAGERLEEPVGEVALTKLVEKAGCASKIDQAFLKQVLKDLPEVEDPRVLVGMPAGDDAGIYDMGDGTALVQTVDVFTPSVDDPYVFGQVAAANSVSDVYAMGGRPLTALSVIGFPVRKIPDEAMLEILRGGIDKMKEAGVAVIGGHSINDGEIKAGFAVTGIIEKENVSKNSAAQIGDVLILTKPLGTGITAFASQIGRARRESVEAAEKSMTTLNKTASELMVEFGAHASTDVTGFSLMGHLTEMALRSSVDAEIVWDDLPWFEGVVEYAAAGILPGAIERNKESCGDRVTAGKNVSEEMVDMCYDAQTSGGLLIAIGKDKAESFLKALHEEGVTEAVVIGQIKCKGSGKVFVETNGKRKMPKVHEESLKGEVVTGKEEISMSEGEKVEQACCGETGGNESGEKKSGVEGIEGKYMEFLSSVGTPSGLDAFTKQAINLALSVAQRCEPCLKAHIKKAKKMGFSEAEIEEAAWMGIAFAGSPAMMFYKQHKSD